MTEIIIQFVILITLLSLSAFFSSAETAMSTVNKVRIPPLASEGNTRAARVLKIDANYPKMLTAILIGNNVVNLSASSLATVIVTKVFGSFAIGLGTGILTILVLIFGEITPKTAAKATAEKMALRYASAIWFLMQTLTPLIFVINVLSGLVLKVLGIRDAGHQTITEKELRTYVNVSHEDGVIKSEEKDMNNNVFDFGDEQAKDIMIPRIDMTCGSTDATLEEVMRIFREEMYTRLPVYEDHPDNMIGMLNIKDMLFVEANQPFHVKDHLRDAYYTYEFKKTANLMMEMREKTVNVAFVLSEYGACAGMITMEDLLEEIVGEIRDEYDSDEEGLINQVGEGKYLIEGTMKLDDVNDALHTSLSSEDYDTIGGLMIGHLDRLPQNRESITLADGTILTCRGLRQHRIIKVLLELPATPNENPSGTFTSK